MRRVTTVFGLAALMALLVLTVGACGQPASDEAPEPVEEATLETGPSGAMTEVVSAALPEGDERVFSFEPVPPGGEKTLVIGQAQEPDSLYLYGGSMLAGTHVLNSIYDGPIEGLDYDFQAVILEQLPKLEVDGSGATLEVVSVEPGQMYLDAATQEVVTATEVVSDLEQLTVRFRLRDGITWQDGVPVTADDSVFSEKLACDPDTPTSKVLCDRTASYDKLDDLTVEWKGIPGYTDQTYYTNFYTPLARHQLGSGGKRMDEMTAEEIREDEEFSRRPYSYGPFVIVEWVADDRIVLERNDHYWRAAEGLPYFDEVVHRIIDDSNTLLAALINEEVDLATQDGLDITQFDALEAAKADGRIEPYYVSGTVWEHVDFNLDPTDERAPVGACTQVRKAIALGTNRQVMVDEIQRGKTLVQHSFVPEEHWAYPESGLVTYDFDPEQAMQILDELGFQDADGDGVREAQTDIPCTIGQPGGATKDQIIPAGTPLTFVLNTTQGNEMRTQTTLLFQQNMKDIGVGVELEYLVSDVFFDTTDAGPLTGRRFDLAQFAWLTGVQPPVALYYCENVPSPDNSWAGQNSTGWCNPEYDRLAKLADTTLERAAALPSYAEAQAIFSDELPVLPLFARVKVMATRPGLMNFKPNATVNSETWNIETWGFAPEQ